MSAVNDEAPLRGGRVAALAAIAVALAAASLLAAPGIQGLFGALLALVAVAIADTDARERIIPDALNAAGFLLGMIQAAMLADRAVLPAACEALARSVIAAGILGLIRLVYRRTRGRNGLGLGDVKLAAVAGAWLDWVTIAVVIEIAALGAIACWLIAGLLRRRALSVTVAMPFGLFLAPAIWLGWLYQIVMDYLTT